MNAPVPVRLQPRGPRGIRGATPSYETDGGRIRFIDPVTGAPAGSWVTVVGAPGPSGDALNFATKSTAEASAITPGQPIVRISGYYTAGGAGAADYASVGSAPAQGGLVSANAQHYEVVQREAVDVCAIGAKGDGTVSDLEACKDARDYAIRKGLRTLYFSRPGDYLFDDADQLDLEGSEWQVIGSGPLCRIINGTEDKACINFGSPSADSFYCGVRNIAFGQKEGVTPEFGNCAILVQRQQFFQASDYFITPFPAALFQGFRSVGHTSGISDLHLHRGFAFNCLDIGHYFELNQGYLGDITSSGCRVGFDFRDNSGLDFGRLHAFGSDDYGMVFGTLGGSRSGNILCGGPSAHLIGDTSGQINIWATSLIDSFIGKMWGSTGKDNGTPGDYINPNQQGILFEGPGVRRVSVGKLRVLQNNGNGLVVKNTGGMPTGIEVDHVQLGAPGQGNGKANAQVGFVEGYGIVIDDGIDVEAQPAIIRIGKGHAGGNYGDGTGTDRDKAAKYPANPTTRFSFGRIDGFTPAPLAAITPSGSPFSWRNGPWENDLIITGGNVTAIAINGQTVTAGTGLQISVHLHALDTITITYSVAPAIVQVPGF